MFTTKIIALTVLTAVAAQIVACSPTFNWREVRFETSPLVALMPCKPEREQRTVDLGGVGRPIEMAACKTGGATFSVAQLDVGQSSQAAQTLALWQAASKTGQARYFSHGQLVVQAAIYGEPQAPGDGPGVLATQVAETFFTGVSLPKP